MTLIEKMMLHIMQEAEDNRQIIKILATKFPDAEMNKQDLHAPKSKAS